MPQHEPPARTVSTATVPMCATHWETLTKTGSGWVCPQCQAVLSFR